MYTYDWFMLFVWQKLTQYCKAIIFQLKINTLKSPQIPLYLWILIFKFQKIFMSFKYPSSFMFSPTFKNVIAIVSLHATFVWQAGVLLTPDLYQLPYSQMIKQRLKETKYILKSTAIQVIMFHIQRNNEAIGKTETFIHSLSTWFTAWENHVLSINFDSLGHNK